VVLGWQNESVSVGAEQDFLLGKTFFCSRSFGGWSFVDDVVHNVFHNNGGGVEIFGMGKHDFCLDSDSGQFATDRKRLGSD